jgi:hypothetical protein
MKIVLKISDEVSIEVEGESEQDLFKSVSRAKEVFGHVKCGKCQSKADYVTRKDSEENDWLEMVCQNPKCRAKLVFGSVKGKDQKLFPKIRWNNLSETQQEQRKDEQAYADSHNGFLPNGGWYIFKKT